MSLNKKKMALIIITAVFFVFIDRLFKFLAINGYFDNPIYLIKNFFSLNFATNYNIAFSLPINGPFLIIIIVLIIIALLYNLIYLYKKQEFIKSGVLILIILGAASNLLDRIEYGHVVDYLDLKYFTVFNIADIMICLGVISLVFFIIKKPNINDKS